MAETTELDEQAGTGIDRPVDSGVEGTGLDEPSSAPGQQQPVWYTAFAFPCQPQPLYRVTHEYAGFDAPNTNFLKGVKWSPDGACLLTASDDNWLRLYDLPQDVHAASRLTHPDLLPPPDPCAEPSTMAADLSAAASTAGGASCSRDLAGPDNLAPALRMHAGETVYDYCWYTRMSTADPVSCCFAVTTRGHPIHLWDACSGSLRCSYRGYNDADEPTAAYSLAFSPDGSRLLGGYEKKIYVFDVSRPGREYRTVVTHKRKQAEGIAGIVSCMAFSPTSDVFAAGTYTGALGVYDARSYDLVLLLSGNRGGLTQVMFSSDGNYLFTGARQDDQMFCWDVRFTYQSLYTLHRDTARTNQRIQFDIEPCGKHLATGNCNGTVKVFDLQSGSQVDQQAVAGDPVNGVAFHPCLDLLATASGHRRYAQPDGPEDDDGNATPATARGDHAAPARPTNSMLVWRLQLQHLQLATAQPADACNAS